MLASSKLYYQLVSSVISVLGRSPRLPTISLPILRMPVVEFADYAIGSMITFILHIYVKEFKTWDQSFRSASREYKTIAREHGHITALVLIFMFPDAFDVMKQVERHVLQVDDKLVLAFIRSYYSTFNMIGVAVSQSPDL